MSEKRKFEDLLDPDYPQNAKLAKTDAKHAPPHSRDERISRIRAIVGREFQRELNAKEQEILEIDDRIQLARKLLSRVRYAVVSNYYSKKGMELPENKAQECVESLNLKSTAPPAKERDQRAVHPALKNILGKKKFDFDEILKARPTREAAKTAKTSIKEKLRTKKEEKRLQRAMNGSLNIVIPHDAPPKLPRHIEPNKAEKKIPQINIARSGNQTKHIIAVGNTSKYVGDEKFVNGITHKWLVYVKTKTPVPIEKLVTKVRFFLHPSYRPHDIVDVFEPPFQIAERGWGEFPIRLQLYFEPSLQQKPVQLMHNLVLDKSMSGLQTMGAETLVEIWLRTDHLQINNKIKNECNSPTTHPTTDDEDNTIDHIDDKLMEFLTRIENQTSKSLCEEDERIEPTIDVSAANSIDFNSTLRENLETIPSMNFHPNDHNETLLNMKQESRSTDVILEPRDHHEMVNIKQESLNTHSISEQRDHHESIEKLSNVCSNDVRFQTNNFDSYPIDVKQELVESTINNFISNLPGAQSHSKSPVGDFIKIPQLNLLKTQPAMASTIIVDKTEPKKPTLPASPETSQSKSAILQKRVFKCFDKKGNVKYIEMLIKSPQSVQGKIVPPSTGLVQKAVVISKLNGQMKDGQTKPVIFKISPSNSTIVAKPTITSTPTTNTVAVPARCILPKQPVKVATTSFSQQISSVPKIPVAKENQSSMPSAKMAANTTNKNQVMVKNGKMYIIDPLQAKIKQQTKKQESLLKPQVSLLKPIVKNDNLNNCIRNDPRGVFNHTAIATDHDYTSLIGKSPGTNKVTIHKPSLSPHQALIKQKSSIVTVNSPNNSRINVIVTKLDDDEEEDDEKFISDVRVHNESAVKLNTKVSITTKPTALMQKPRRDYQSELEISFRSAKLTTVRQAVDYLLKRLPLISNKAASVDFNVSFPFVVKSQAVFDQLVTPKLKANEWLRAKFIQRLLKKHSQLAASQIWTTKEIILFARLHAYTPVIKYRIGKEFNNNSNKNEIDSTLKDLVKKEIKRERYDIQTISLVHGTYDWINQIRLKIKDELQANVDVIDVDGIDNEDKPKQSNELSPLKNMTGKYFVSLDSSRESEATFVNDACQQVGIRLKPEEIVRDVVYPAAQLVLAQCLRSFIDDLLRRAAACRPDVDFGSPLVESAIKPDDIKNAILSRPQWDFLTNDGLGVARPKEQKQ